MLFQLQKKKIKTEWKWGMGMKRVWNHYLFNQPHCEKGSSCRLEEQRNANVIRPSQSGTINKVPLTSITHCSCYLSSCTYRTSALFLLCHKYFWAFQKGSPHTLRRHPTSHYPHMAFLEFSLSSPSSAPVKPLQQ